MNASAKRRRARRGFTLVELLTVVVIIGILASLITAAVIHARIAALNAVVSTQIGDLAMAVENYKNEYGEYPPDFTNAAAVTRHLRVAFPRYDYTRFGADLGTYGLDPTNFDAASALVFWLGGLPEVAPGGDPWMPAGFHADPANPFKPGLPRTKPLYEFKSDQVRKQHASKPLRFFPQGIDRGPLVYFRASRDATTGLYGYAGVSCSPGSWGVCVPYKGPGNAWRSQKTFQIIYAGMDGNFGSGGAGTRVSKTFAGFTQEDYDNIANFSAGTLEDETE
jgi:prepilin-type N-terminal cleavage/methylation domain-containing protein